MAKKLEGILFFAAHCNNQVQEEVNVEEDVFTKCV